MNFGFTRTRSGMASQKNGSVLGHPVLNLTDGKSYAYVPIPFGEVNHSTLGRYADSAASIICVNVRPRFSENARIRAIIDLVNLTDRTSFALGLLAIQIAYYDVIRMSSHIPWQVSTWQLTPEYLLYIQSRE
jgi:hypothetical protein